MRSIEVSNSANIDSKVSKDTEDEDNEAELLTTENAGQLMIAARLIKLAQRQPVTKPPTTASQDIIQLSELTNRAHDNLFESKPMLVFVLNASVISIDRQKVTVVHRSLFKTRHTTSIQIGDIINVQASIGVMYGSLMITSKHFLNNVQNAHHLSRGDVIRARRLLQGLIIAYQAKVDITKIDTEQLLRLLTDLGQENRAQ
jgi:hypothetical protein